MERAGPPGHTVEVQRSVDRSRAGPGWDALAHLPARRPRLRDTDVVRHGGVAPEGATLPELSQEALHDVVAHHHVDDADGWYYEQPPFDLGWVLGPRGFDPAPGGDGPVVRR